MLDDEVLDAVEKGRFNIYAVETVDQALSLLMDKDAGEMTEQGYQDGSINALALARLANIADIVNGDNDDEKDAE